jgi:hypothetical protein
MLSGAISPLGGALARPLIAPKTLYAETADLAEGAAPAKGSG